MKRIFILLPLLLILNTMFSQQIDNLSFSIVNNKLEFKYDILGAKTGQEFEVKLRCVEVGGENYLVREDLCSGDLGKFISSEDTDLLNLKIIYDISKTEKKINDEDSYTVDITIKTLPIPELVFIEGGTFQMGNNSGYDNEKPIHSVTVDDFKMSKNEITFEEYDYFCSETGRNKPNDNSWGRGARPVIYVSWNDADAYCKWLSQKVGKTYRLPTEAEWEYAAADGNSQSKYAGTNNKSSLDSCAWYIENAEKKTHQVGQKKPNKFGLYDMSGNVWEWCNDWYGNYLSGSQTNPKGVASGTERVNRGGGWNDLANNCQIKGRDKDAPSDSYEYLGFRIVSQ